MNYSKLKVSELREIAESRGLRNLKGVKKDELVELLTNIDKMNEAKKAANENVADLEYDEERQEFNLVFYYDQLLTQLEKTILNKESQS